MSETKHVDTKVTNHGTGTVEVDGVDLGPTVAGFRLDVHAGDMPRLTLDVLLRGGGHVAGEAAVVVDEATASLLTSLGWTPPDGAA